MTRLEQIRTEIEATEEQLRDQSISKQKRENNEDYLVQLWQTEALERIALALEAK